MFHIFVKSTWAQKLCGSKIEEAALTKLLWYDNYSYWAIVIDLEVAVVCVKGRNK